MLGSFELFFLVLAVSISVQVSAQRRRWWESPDTAERVLSNDYPCEKHKVTTKDGYILTLYRIPHGKNESNLTKSRRPVIVQHGILCTSDCWVVNDPSRGLGYILADNGFDVWLPNSRGSTYSREHVNWSWKDGRYWDFSIHEMGMYDLPAIVDYVMVETGHEKLTYVGHSQGTSVFYIMASLLPGYAEKISVAVTLAPVVYLDSTRGAIQALGRVSSSLEKLADFLRIKYILDHNVLIQELDHLVCRIPIVNNICGDFLFLISGFDSPALDKKVIARIGEFCPSGSSIKDLKHFGQWTRNGGKFSMFDYGKDNMKYYNATKPPEYPLGNIETPVAIFYSCNDFISSCPEVRRLSKILPNLVEMFEVPFKKFNHIDFMWARNAWKVLYPELIRVLKLYN